MGAKEYVRHRTGLSKPRITLPEFRKKYGKDGVSDVLNLIIEHVQLDAKSKKGLKQISDDIRSLLQEG